MTGKIGTDAISGFEGLEAVCRKRCALLENRLKGVIKPRRSCPHLDADRLCRRNSRGAGMSSSYDNRASRSCDRKTRLVEHGDLERVLAKVSDWQIYGSVIRDGHASRSPPSFGSVKLN